MKKNIKALTPKCGICGLWYSPQDNDGSGLCLNCRPSHSQPLLKMRRRLKRKIVMEVGKIRMDDFDSEELKAFETEVNAERQVEQFNANSYDSNSQDKGEVEKELKIEDIIEPGRYGVSNSQMIPAMKKAIEENSIAKLKLLRNTYLATFDQSIRYLKKAEREYIAQNEI